MNNSKLENKILNLCIKDEKGKTTLINCSNKTTIIELKKLIQENIDIHYNDQVLIFDRKILENNYYTLDDYYINKTYFNNRIDVKYIKLITNIENSLFNNKLGENGIKIQFTGLIYSHYIICKEDTKISYIKSKNKEKYPYNSEHKKQILIFENYVDLDDDLTLEFYGIYHNDKIEYHIVDVNQVDTFIEQQKIKKQNEYGINNIISSSSSLTSSSLTLSLTSSLTSSSSSSSSSTSSSRLIHIKINYNDKEHNISYYNNITVKDLKYLIIDELNIETDRQKLMFNNKELEDISLLSRCNINDGDVIKVLQLPRTNSNTQSNITSTILSNSSNNQTSQISINEEDRQNMIQNSNSRQITGREVDTEENCYICLEKILNATPLHVFQNCSHLLHKKCYNQCIEHNSNYKCSLCK